MSDNIRQAVKWVIGAIVLGAACLLLSGCFIANARERSRLKKLPDPNLPEMTVTTNLLRTPVLPRIE